MKNNEIFRGPELFPDWWGYPLGGDVCQNDTPVLGKGTAKTQGFVNGLP